MSKLKIPKIFHRIWLGNNPMPEDYIKYGETWIKHHPDWKMILWTDQNMIPLENQNLYDSTDIMAMKADIARYEILYHFGGVYIDTDFECLKNIEPLLDEVTAFAASEDNYYISIGIMGGTLGHQIFKTIIDQLPKSIDEYRFKSLSCQTGPAFVTRILKDTTLLDVFEKDIFYPYYYTETEKKNDNFPEAYAVHHWSSSWFK